MATTRKGPPWRSTPRKNAGLFRRLSGRRGMSLLDRINRDISVELRAMRCYALVLTRVADQAEDLVQDSLSRAIASAHAWQPSRDLRPWLLAIVHNTHLKRQRRQKLDQVATDEAGWAHDRAVQPPQGDRVELARTMAALMDLPEEQRAALVLVAFEGLAYKDAAEILGLPLGTLMSRLARARDALRAATGRGRQPEARPTLRMVR